MTPEMRAFEYALGLFSVLIGLAIARLALLFATGAWHYAPYSVN